MATIEERSRKAYPENHPCDYECREGFRKACKEYESLPKIRGYMARDGFERINELCIYKEKPTRPSEDGLAIWKTAGCGVLRLPKEMFPEITWESEPVEVELLIRKI